MKKWIFAAMFTLAACSTGWGQELPVVCIPTEGTFVPTRATVWGSTEFLLWWVKNNNLSTPLVTTTSNPGATDAKGNNVAAGLGRSGTSVLVGNGDIRYNNQSGARFIFGGWLDCEGTIGIEAQGFFLAQKQYSRTFTSAPNGNPVIGTPIIDTAGLFGGGENAIVNSFPGTFKGSTAVVSRTSLWGAEVSGLFNAVRNDCFTVDLLLGFRYADLTDQVGVIGQSSNLVPTNKFGGVFFVNDFFNGTVTSTDSFRTRNQFYGGQVGIKSESRFGQAFVMLNAKVAMGATHQVQDINGSSTLQTTNGVNLQTNGGTLALASNIGHFTRNEFSVIPELDVRVGYNLTDRVRTFVGYNYIYWSDVARSGDQIDRNVDVRQVPTVPTFDPNAHGTQPSPQFRNSNFWAQGITFGMEFRY